MVSLILIFKILGNSVLWNPHNVELALWTHYVASELKPELLESIPSAVKNGKAHQNGDVESTELKTAVSNTSMAFSFHLSNSFSKPAYIKNCNKISILYYQVIDPSSEDSNLDPANGKSGSASVAASDTNVDENSTTSFTEDSMDKPLTPASGAAAPESASNGAGGEETNDSIATSDSATNDSTVVETAKFSQESATEEEESRSSVIEAKESSNSVEPASLNENVEVAVAVEPAEKRKSDDSEVPVAKKAKTEQDEDVKTETNAEVAEEAK